MLKKLEDGIKPNNEMKHILIGKDLLLNVEHILSANLTAKDKEDKECIKIITSNQNEWTIWANLGYSRDILRAIPKVNDQFDLLENIKGCVMMRRRGRESNVSKEIKQILKHI